MAPLECPPTDTIDTSPLIVISVIGKTAKDSSLPSSATTGGTVTQMSGSSLFYTATWFIIVVYVIGPVAFCLCIVIFVCACTAEKLKRETSARMSHSSMMSHSCGQM
jgi:hypothetical protein